MQLLGEISLAFSLVMEASSLTAILLSFILKDASAIGFSLHINALDLSKPFDGVDHSQVLYPWSILPLCFWFEKFVSSNKGSGALSSFNVSFRQGVHI